jgi:uncharacterized protein YvpB
MVATVLVTVGGSGLLLYSGSPFVIQSQAVALQARWTEMIAQGVPASDLAALQHQWAGAQDTRYLAVALVFFRPDSSAIIDEWQAETDAVWGRNLNRSRARAVASNENLRVALGVEPSQQRKDRAIALESASTPNEYKSLSSDWDTAAILVPINRDIATLVSSIADLSVQTRALGIVSDPASELVTRSNGYTHEGTQTQAADAAFLLKALTVSERDLRARLAAAAITKAGYGPLANQLSLVRSYGVNVKKYQAGVEANHAAYATATTVAQFTALTADLNAIFAKAHHAGLVALAAMHSANGDSSVHIIPGMPLYYQRHALSCEETSTSMGLVHQGLHISQDQILARLGVDRTPARLVNGYVVRWGNPDRAFVGNVNGSENNYTGQQANPKALVRVLNSYGAKIVEWSEPGVGPNVISAQEIYKQVAAGHPVVAYATWDWNWHRIYYYRSEDGNRVPLISPADDHVYLVVGVSATRVLINDPIRGQYWVSKGAFNASYEFGMAIVLA